MRGGDARKPASDRQSSGFARFGCASLGAQVCWLTSNPRNKKARPVIQLETMPVDR
jgi:hypothetical protein